MGPFRARPPPPARLARGWQRPRDVATRILLVDDEDSIHFAMQTYFSVFGYSVDGARSSAEALERLAGGSYPVVIVDLRLSKPSAQRTEPEGLGIVSRVRRDYPDTRVVVLTACDAELEPEALRRGAHCFLQKPQPLSRLVHIVEQLSRGESDAG